jgi:hypothetical protein
MVFASVEPEESIVRNFPVYSIVRKAELSTLKAWSIRNPCDGKIANT